MKTRYGIDEYSRFGEGPDGERYAIERYPRAFLRPRTVVDALLQQGTVILWHASRVTRIGWVGYQPEHRPDGSEW